MPKSMPDQPAAVRNLFIILLSVLALEFVAGLFYALYTVLHLRIDPGIVLLIEYGAFHYYLASLAPYILEIDAFLLGLWYYAWTVWQINNGMSPVSRPMGILWGFILPVINLFSIGLAFSRLANYLDNPRFQERYKPATSRIKTGLIAMYAGIMGIVFSYGFASTLPQDEKAKQLISFLIFRLIYLLLVLIMLFGLIRLVKGVNRVQYQSPGPA